MRMVDSKKKRTLQGKSKGKDNVKRTASKEDAMQSEKMRYKNADDIYE